MSDREKGWTNISITHTPAPGDEGINISFPLASIQEVLYDVRKSECVQGGVGQRLGDYTVGTLARCFIGSYVRGAEVLYSFQ